MSTISNVPDRSDGEILTAAKYNSDHGVHETNANNLNNDKVETSDFEAEHSSSGVHGDSVLQSLGLTSSDNVSFNSVTASGDISRFASIDMQGQLTVTGDAVITGDARIAGDFQVTGVITAATADFLGTVSVDTLIPQQNSPGAGAGDSMVRIWNDTHSVAHLYYLVAGSIERNHNIASVSKNSTGRFKISFQTALGNASPDIQLSSETAAGNTISPMVASIDRNTGGQATLFNTEFRDNNGTLIDPAGIFVTVSGLARSS